MFHALIIVAILATYALGTVCAVFLVTLAAFTIADVHTRIVARRERKARQAEILTRAAARFLAESDRRYPIEESASGSDASTGPDRHSAGATRMPRHHHHTVRDQ